MMAFVIIMLKFQVIPFKTQARNFKKVTAWLRHKLGSSEAKTLLSNSVYMFSIGSNDYLSPLFTHSGVLNSYSHSEYVGMVVGNLTSILKVHMHLPLLLWVCVYIPV